MKILKFPLILFITILLFSCCPEKKNNKSESKEVIQSDSSRIKAIIREYKQLTDEDFEFDLNDFEGKWGPV
ncbi:hypothetical protein [Culturomica massiliensis]|jgi:uncharacterized protein YcfL|uniref:hypothetical protein n=1 Tax=Culturomica massiliensis TaxID=1841857 RepID=UPI000E558B02|nr:MULTISPECIES: hypothetical protein [Odoribacteraceae]RHV86819.1 hypothetical protein DXA95_17365 [Odoribacter sp. OF09-27XD]